MAESPGKNAGRLVSFTIYSEGSKINEAYELTSISVISEVNRIGSATLEFQAGNMPEKDFPLSNDDTFKPGKSIKIDAGYESEEETLFEGLIISHGLRLPSTGDTLLVVECRDLAVKTTAGRKNAVYEKMKDSDVISKILGSYGGLSTEVGATSITHKELIQYYSSDWDFILSRADVNGLVVISNGKKVSVKVPDVKAEAVLKITFGEDLIDFSGEVDARDQYEAVQAVGWDPATQKVLTADGSAPELNKQGNLSQSDLAGVMDVDKFVLQAGIPLEKGVLKNWADALLLKFGLSRFRGKLSFLGSAKVTPGSILEVDGLGKRFNGKVYVGAVTHWISGGDWKTEVGLGISPEFITDRENVICSPASGLLPGIEGLQIGKVSKLDGDPDNESRIQVEIPILNGDINTVWARLSNFYGTNQSGNFFLPEIDDEVILGFFNNDPRYPVILGSLYSSKNTPPYKQEAANNTKAIVTREKMKIEFDEEKKVINIATPGKNQIVISDDAKGIKLSDQNNNVIEMDDQGISLTSAKDITLKANSKIVLNATSDVQIKSSTNVDLKGLNVQASADTGLTMKGNATAELSASGQTTVKGAMVMIN
ncbi:type VI secretion system tip protein VgrG [Marinilabiliaceae bacterium JC017]|nr:type VI secretion system tip protein VgrG [Marinilabiliaceae bacterium JC017]